MPKTPTLDRLPIVFRPDYRMNIGEHVFPMEKYEMVRQILQEEGWLGPDNLIQGQIATREELGLVHTEAFLRDFENLAWTPRTMFSELPMSHEIVRGFKLMAGGTIKAARTALQQGVACHIGGGFHHAFADHAEGFCYINDIALAIRVMQKEDRICRAAVLDVDLHQGNGTAHIFADDPEVFTVSIHQEELYPIKQESNIDVGLTAFTGDDVYLNHLREIVPAKIARHYPELVVYVAGADPYKHDQLGHLQMTFEGLQQRDRIVAEACRENGWALVTVFAGGYAIDKRDTARIHANTIIEVAKAWGIEPRI